MTKPEHYLLSGEFHYFRVPKSRWADRLKQVRDLGMEAVSIYIPWNWHQPRPATLDLTGQTLPERDLPAALEAIARAGLKCIFRPGPFITNEWRDGGLPDWLWVQAPQILSLDVRGHPSGYNRPYPVITYAHPAYRSACQKWFEDVLGAVQGYWASQGGPIFHVQLDDEPSYWHLLSSPLMADYNPYLIAPGEAPSLYARWLLDRYTSLDRLNASHHTQYQTGFDIAPPRQPMAQPNEFVGHADWLDFKLWMIDDYTRFLYQVIRAGGVRETISQLYPYLLPMQAPKHADYLRQHQLTIELTNEIYLNLFSANTVPEQKVGHVVFGYELYHMWRGEGHGPAITMELQGSNASFITPDSLNLLYALTVARGVKGFNIFMLVGGENPPGYENLTGSNYDVSAPIGPGGEERLHAATLRQLIRVIRTSEREILAAEPLRDAWWGCYAPYETGMLVGGEAALGEVGFAMQFLINSGEHGLADVTNLQALLTLSSASFGCLDLQRATPEQMRQAPQIWVFSLDFMERAVQEKLADYVTHGGHLVILPMLPHCDEQRQPCEVLLELIMRGMPRPEFAGLFPAYPRLVTQVRGRAGESLVAPGRPTTFDLPDDATALAYQASDNRPCAFERPVGAGQVTMLGFPLVYLHTASARQKEFIAGIIETQNRPRWASTRNLQMLAMELANADSGFVCVVNPVDLPATTRVNYTVPATRQPACLPLVLEGLTLSRRGARLLPVGLSLGQGVTLRHATWELVEKKSRAQGVMLHLAAQPGELGEAAFEGDLDDIRVLGGSIQSVSRLEGPLTVVVIQAGAEEVKLQVAAREALTQRQG
jgi:beta-galactosidase